MTEAVTDNAGQRASDIILEVGELEAGYGKKEVVYDLSFHLTRGEKLIFLGHNGAGKTTTMAGLFGILRPKAGTIRFEGHDITGRTPAENVRDGIAYVPQGHGIFRRLTVRDNLDLGAEQVVVDLNDETRGAFDLHLMSCCAHHVIANSTFSWWGAWLNPTPGKRVIAPANWFGTAKLSNPDLIPEGWLRL